MKEEEAKREGKSYVRQGLCVNISCELFFMNSTRLEATGKIAEGGQCSPKDWGKSGGGCVCAMSGRTT